MNDNLIINPHKKPGFFSRLWKWTRRLVLFLVVVTIILAGLEAYHLSQPMPQDVSFTGNWRDVSSIRFYGDETFIDENGNRQVRQQIFDRIFELIDQSEKFILIDMFYFNQFRAKEDSRPISQMLVDRLIARKMAFPDIRITVISDPINHVYGSTFVGPLFQLKNHDIKLVFTELNKLKDSNPAWSMIWRPLIRPFGTGKGDLLPNPFHEGGMSLRSGLKLLNFKANHRKTIVADNGGRFTAIVSSANPHDASWAHDNIAIEFTGDAVLDLVTAENAVLDLSGADKVDLVFETDPQIQPLDNTLLRVVTEESILTSALNIIESLQSGDQMKLAMFFLSERSIVEAIKQALAKGADVQLLLDPNSESFGKKRIGIPNRYTAWELFQAGADIRWADTHGEQMHAKMLLVFRKTGEAVLLAGSANYTRRNIGGYNLECDVEVMGKRDQEFFQQANAFFERMWHNRGGKYSDDFSQYADSSLSRRWLMRFQEFSGMSTF